MKVLGGEMENKRANKEGIEVEVSNGFIVCIYIAQDQRGTRAMAVRSATRAETPFSRQSSREINPTMGNQRSGASGNSPIAFKVTESTKSSRNYTAALLKAKCPQLLEAISAQIWQGK